MKGRRFLFIILAIVIIGLYVPRFDPRVRYVQLDVGQGDGAVIRADRHAVLVDVGPENEYAALRYLRHEGLFVDLIILSHTDEDHAGALETLLSSEIGIPRIALPTGAFDEIGSEAVANTLVSAEGAGVSIEFYERGDKIIADSFSFDVLSPDEWMTGSNERSLALYAEIGEMHLLTLGDLPEKSEMEEVPPCDILKVAHHGSRYATSRELIEKARPEIAVISVGRNSYGHPTDRVLEDLADVGANVFRTDHSGCITVREGESGRIVTPYVKNSR